MCCSAASARRHSPCWRHCARCQADVLEVETDGFQVASQTSDHTDLISRGSPSPLTPRHQASLLRFNSIRQAPAPGPLHVPFLLECSFPDIHVTPCLPSFHILLNSHSWSGVRVGGAPDHSLHLQLDPVLHALPPCLHAHLPDPHLTLSLFYSLILSVICLSLLICST